MKGHSIAVLSPIFHIYSQQLFSWRAENPCQHIGQVGFYDHHEPCPSEFNSTVRCQQVVVKSPVYTPNQDKDHHIIRTAEGRAVAINHDQTENLWKISRYNIQPRWQVSRLPRNWSISSQPASYHVGTPIMDYWRSSTYNSMLKTVPAKGAQSTAIVPLIREAAWSTLLSGTGRIEVGRDILSPAPPSLYKDPLRLQLWAAPMRSFNHADSVFLPLPTALFLTEW